MDANLSMPLSGSEEPLSESTGYTVLHVFSLVVLTVTFILGVLGNGFVIWVARFRMTHTVTTTCYVNLAVANFFFSAILPFLIASMAMGGHWPFGLHLCKLVHTVVDVNLFISVFLIALITLDRSICILHPVWAQNHRTVGLAKKVILGPWVLALLLTLPVIIFLTTVRHTSGNVHCIFSFPTWGDTLEERLKVAITVATVRGAICFTVGFSVPMSVVAICYGCITAKLCREGVISHPLRVLNVVVAYFFICWFPFQLVTLLRTVWLREMLFEGKYQVLNVLLYPTSTLAFVNSCLNPILYVFMGRDSRERLIHSLPTSLERALSEDSATNSASSPAEAELQAK